MRRRLLSLCFSAGFLSALALGASAQAPARFDYQAARTHEIKPHRFNIPHQGVRAGFNQLHLTLIVSPEGLVVKQEATGDKTMMTYWPDIQGEVAQWRFVPFEVAGKPVTAEVEEYIDLVPPERLPKVHVAPPVLKPGSQIEISLERTLCFGTCPAYVVTMTNETIVFDRGYHVVAKGRHVDTIDPDAVRKLAERFLQADFYSLDPQYRAHVTDNPTYILSVEIDGREKQVLDYQGASEGMPSIVTELEDEVDELANTKRWISGGPRLVESLRQENFDAQSYEAQTILTEAAKRNQLDTVRELLAFGVPVQAAIAATGNKTAPPTLFLTAASRNPLILQTLITVHASESNQADKDQALGTAAYAGNVEDVRMLLAYGANPNADFTIYPRRTKAVTRDEPAVDPGIPFFVPSTYKAPETSAQEDTSKIGPGTVLLAAAESGNPEVVKLLLKYHPQLEIRDSRGETAMIAAAALAGRENEGRPECVRLLGEAGARVNVADTHGNTPLHYAASSLTAEALLKLGAEVNAQNQDGDTPLFMTFDPASVSLLIEHGADLSIRDKAGKTIADVAGTKAATWQDALRVAIEHERGKKR